VTEMEQPAAAVVHVPEQARLPWRVALTVGLAGLRRRFLRSLITTTGVILAIAFLAYMLTTDAVVRALLAANEDAVNVRLQQHGIDIYRAGGTDRMTILLLVLSLLTCTVGIVNSMLMAVAERVKEIGTLKCLGATDGFIVKTYFVEACLQSLCGALAGMCLGLAVALGVAFATYRGAVFRHLPGGAVAETLLVCAAIGLTISVVSAIGPAYLAARKQPVDALRIEE
jgi:putative ABC transport system permease protein